MFSYVGEEFIGDSATVIGFVLRPSVPNSRSDIE
jgi:hypothetical protein